MLDICILFVHRSLYVDCRNEKKRRKNWRFLNQKIKETVSLHNYYLDYYYLYVLYVLYITRKTLNEFCIQFQFSAWKSSFWTLAHCVLVFSFISVSLLFSDAFYSFFLFLFLFCVSRCMQRRIRKIYFVQFIKHSLVLMSFHLNRLSTVALFARCISTEMHSPPRKRRTNSITLN